jgi:hypothetical protein
MNAPRRSRSSIVALLATLLAAGLLSLAGLAGARGAPAETPTGPAAPRPIIKPKKQQLLAVEIPAPPQAAAPYRRQIQQNAYRVFGLNAPTAVLTAQLHQESSWKPTARSWVGAEGLAQFMPATARDMAKRYPAECAPANPLDPAWAIRCQHRYMQSQLAAIKPKPADAPMLPCAHWAFGLSAYNGGLGWVQRDRAAAAKAGADPNQWFGAVELTPDRRRAPQFVKENRGYPQRILLVLQPRYVKHWNMRGLTCA